MKEKPFFYIFLRNISQGTGHLFMFGSRGILNISLMVLGMGIRGQGQVKNMAVYGYLNYNPIMGKIHFAIIVNQYQPITSHATQLYANLVHRYR